MDWLAEGLLEGCSDEDSRSARVELLEELTRAGVSVEDLHQAVREDRLALLPAETFASGEPEFSAAEVAERAGVPVNLLRRLHATFGVAPAPDGVPGYTESDLEAARIVARLRSGGLPDEGILDTARVIGQAMAGVSESTMDLVGDAFARAGADEHELGLRWGQAARELVPLVGPLLAYGYRTALLRSLRQRIVDRETLAKGQTVASRAVSVAFADLVGFTRLGEQVDARELGALSGRLTEMAAAVAEHPVRLVKTIGDAVMLVTTEEPETLIDAVIALVGATGEEGEEFPRVRVGIANGLALPRAGDWYGRPVNLASRITAKARPGSVLATEDLKEAAGSERYQWSFAGHFRLRGLEGEVPLHRCRPAEASEADDPAPR